MHDMTLLEIIKISKVIPIMIVCSIIMVAYLIERLIAYGKVGKIDPSVADRVKQALRGGQIKEAINLCARNESFLTRAIEGSLQVASFGKEEMENVFNLYRMRLQAILNKNLAIFGTLSFIGPLLGLLGTVLGVIQAFRDLAISGSGGPTIVAAGIAEALIATAFGIAVAVPSAVLYNYFTTKVRTQLQSYDQLAQEIMILVHTSGGEKGGR